MLKKITKSMMLMLVPFLVGIAVMAFVISGRPPIIKTVERQIPPPYWPSRPTVEKDILATFNVYPAYTKYVCDAVSMASKKYAIPPSLITSLIATESAYQFNAVSTKNCLGMMQINYAVWRAELAKAGIAKNRRDLYDPAVNIDAGCFIMRKALDQTNNDVERALYLYFGADNRDYSNKVLTGIGKYALLGAVPVGS